MAKIPIYESQVNPQQVDSVKTDPALFSSAAQGGTEMVQKVDEINQKFYQLNALNQKTKASTDLKIEQAEVVARAKADPDISKENKAKYQGEIEQLTGKYAGTITDGPTRYQATQAFKLDNFVANSTIDTDFKERLIQNQEYQFSKSLWLGEEAYVQEVDPAKRQLLKTQALTSIDEQVAAEVLTPAAGKSARKVVNEDWDKGWQKENLQKVLDVAPENMSDALEGATDISAEERADWLKLSEAKIASNERDHEKAMKKKKKAYEDLFDTRLFEEKLTINDLEKAKDIEEKDGGPSRSMLNTLKGTLMKGTLAKSREIANKGPDTKRSQKFITAVRKVFSESTTDITKAYEVLIKAAGDKVITQEEGKVLDKIIKMSNDIDKRKEKTGFQSWYNKMTKFHEKFDKPIEEAESDLRSYIYNHTKSDDSESIYKDIVKESQARAYPEYTDWEEGKTYDTDIGSVIMQGRDVDGMPIIKVINGN